MSEVASHVGTPVPLFEDTSIPDESPDIAIVRAVASGWSW